MGEKKKTAPDVEAIESGAGNQISGQAIRDPLCNSTIQGNSPQGIVLIEQRQMGGEEFAET